MTDTSSMDHHPEPATRPARWPSWLAVAVAVPTVIAVQTWLLPALLPEAAPVPEDPCGLVPRDTWNLLVPEPRIVRSEARNTEGDHAGSCEVETRTAASEAKAHVTIWITRHDRGNRTSRTEAQNDFAASKKLALDRAEGRCFDIRDLGDSAFVEITQMVPRVGESGGDWVTVRLEVLSGSDTLKVTYGAAPTDPDLAIGAAVALARHVVGGLGR